jgi:hypothetical protein
VAARWWLLIVLVASCKRHERGVEPDPTPSKPASGYSVTKKNPIANDSVDAATAAAGAAIAEGKALSGVTALSVGAERACALTGDGEAWCWLPGEAATPLGAPGRVKALAGAACALLEDLSVWCPPQRLELLAAGMTGAGQIAASATDYCATRRLFVWCWKPGDQDARKQFDWAGVDRLAVGDGRACSVVGGGEIECVDLTAEAPRAQVLGGLEDVVSLAIQAKLSCAAHTNGSAECWTDVRQRLPIPGISSARSLALGPQGDACVLGTGGSVTCWKLAMTPLAIERPVTAVTGVNATAIGVGAGFACALGVDHAARCWSTRGGKPQVIAKR